MRVDQPVPGFRLDQPDVPQTGDAELFNIYKEELIATPNQEADPDDGDVGTFNTFRLTGTRGSDAQYTLYFSAHGPVAGADRTVTIRHGYIDGLTVDETSAHSARSRASLSVAHKEMASLADEKCLPRGSYGLIVLASCLRGLPQGAKRIRFRMWMRGCCAV